MAERTLDAVDRRVRSLLLDGARRAYHFPQPVPFVWCVCGHADDEHHGPGGELECSARGCSCGKFEAGT